MFLSFFRRIKKRAGICPRVNTITRSRSDAYCPMSLTRRTVVKNEETRLAFSKSRARETKKREKGTAAKVVGVEEWGKDGREEEWGKAWRWGEGTASRRRSQPREKKPLCVSLSDAGSWVK